MSFTPTPEQSAIVDAAVSSPVNLMITAYAGCSKTTTLELIARALPPKRSLILAFNAKNKKEFEKKFPKHFTCLTLNGLGHRAWASAVGRKLTLESNKLGDIISAQIKEREDSRELWNDARVLVSRAMSRGLVPESTPGRGLMPDNPDSWQELCDELWIESTPELLSLARAVLLESIRQSYAGLISFDDQIYMSALFGGVFDRYPLVMVDEAQDLSPVNHVQLRKAASGRLIVVGDPKQAIYAFRGTDSSSMAKIKALRAGWQELPLATTFRCPEVIVERMQDHAPGFQAYGTNPKGRVISLLDWTWKDIETLIPPHGHPAVLCRNNAPLLSLAFKLIRQRVSVVFLGRDIGKGLIALSKKILPDNDTLAEECSDKINDWAQGEIAVALANNREAKAESILDRAQCLLAVLESGKVASARELREALTELFAREVGKVTLSTGHRAKGLEWDLVLHLDPFRIPSPKARAHGGSALEQELNLLYVLETRTKSVLVNARLEDFQ